MFQQDLLLERQNRYADRHVTYAKVVAPKANLLYYQHKILMIGLSDERKSCSELAKPGHVRIPGVFPGI
jgi:hypothetical protein